jgi:hypothetical protein
MALANLSISPPGGYGTISVMDLVGQASADTEINMVVIKANSFFIYPQKVIVEQKHC